MNSTFRIEAPRRGVVTVSVEEADYATLVQNKLRSIRRTASMPGFRQGMVPASLIAKRYGTATKIEEINRLVGDKLYATLREQDANFYGNPMIQPNEEDLETGKDFTFTFHIALAPEFNIPMDKTVKLPYYTIEATEKAIKDYDEQLRRSYGKMESVEVVGSEDAVFGTLIELDEAGNPKEGGFRRENLMLLPSTFKSEEEKAKFIGASNNSVIRYNPYKADGETDDILANVLDLKVEEVAQYHGDFNYELEKINHFVPASLGEEFYKKLFGEETGVKDEAAYRAEVEKRVKDANQRYSDILFGNEVMEYIKKNVGKPEFDVETYRPFIEEIESKEGKPLTDERFQQILDFVFTSTAVRAVAQAIGATHTEEDIRKYAFAQARNQFVQMGYPELPDNVLESFVKNQLEDENRRSEMEYAVTIEMVAQKAHDLVTLETQTITQEEARTKIVEANAQE